MRYFYDTEFIEDGKTIDLISIGMVAEDGREFYAQNADCRFYRASVWVRENVLPYLVTFINDGLEPVTRRGQGPPWLRHDEIGHDLKLFVGDDPKPEFWGYYSAYDHVALCQLFGTMIDLPHGRYKCETCGWITDDSDPEVCPVCRQHGVQMGVLGVVGAFPMYTNDLKQWCKMLGNPKLPQQGKDEHRALSDARWNYQAWEFLRAQEE